MCNTQVQKKRNLDFREILTIIRNNFFNDEIGQESSFFKTADIILTESDDGQSFYYDFDSRRPAEWDLEFIMALYSEVGVKVGIYLDNILISTQTILAGCYNALVCNPIPIYFYQIYNKNYLIRFEIRILSEIGETDRLNMKLFVCHTCPESLEKYPYIQYMKSVIFSVDENKLKNIFYSSKSDKRITICDDDQKNYRDEKFFIYHEIPSFYQFTENYREFLAKKTCDLIRYELLEITMHPDRLDWFLSNDDKKKYKIRLI